MDMDKILENLDEINIDEIAMPKVELSEIEIRRIRKNFKKEIRGRKNQFIKKSIMIASIVIIISFVGIITNPVAASNLPIIRDIYRELVFFAGYEEYTNFIGVSKEDNGYKFTIENIIATPSIMEVGIKVESEKPFKKKIEEDQFQILLNIPSLKAAAYNINSHYIDDNTVILTSRYKNLEDAFPEKGDLAIQLYKMNQGGSTEAFVRFDTKINFEKSFECIKKIKINKNVDENIKIKYLETSLMGTSLVYEENNTIGEGGAIGNYTNYLLELDGVVYKATGFFGSDNDFMVDFPTIDSSKIAGAKDISLLIAESNSYSDNTLNVEYITENNITYPKSIVGSSGNKVEFTKVEREDNKIRFYLNSEYNPIILFNNIYCMGSQFKIEDDIVARYYNGNLYKSGNEYVMEFDNIGNDKYLKLEYGETEGANIESSNSIGKIKIK